MSDCTPGAFKRTFASLLRETQSFSEALSQGFSETISKAFERNLQNFSERAFREYSQNFWVNFPRLLENSSRFSQRIYPEHLSNCFQGFWKKFPEFLRNFFHGFSENIKRLFNEYSWASHRILFPKISDNIFKPTERILGLFSKGGPLKFVV